MAHGFAITWALLTSFLLVGSFFTAAVLSGATGEGPHLSGGWRVGRARRTRYRERQEEKSKALWMKRVAKKGGARIARDGEADVSIVLRLVPSLSTRDVDALRDWARTDRPKRSKSTWTMAWFIGKKLVQRPQIMPSLGRFYFRLATQLLDYVGRGTAAGLLLVGVYWFLHGGPPDNSAETLNLVALVSFVTAAIALLVWLLKMLDEMISDRLVAALLILVLAMFFYVVGPGIWDR
jgi:hypothetical protein